MCEEERRLSQSVTRARLSIIARSFAVAVILSSFTQGHVTEKGPVSSLSSLTHQTRVEGTVQVRGVSEEDLGRGPTAKRKRAAAAILEPPRESGMVPRPRHLAWQITLFPLSLLTILPIHISFRHHVAQTHTHTQQRWCELISENQVSRATRQFRANDFSLRS